MSRPRAHGVWVFSPPLIFYCPIPHPLATHTHTRQAVLTVWTIQGMTCLLPWEKAKGLRHSLKTNPVKWRFCSPISSPPLPLPPGTPQTRKWPRGQRNRVCLNSVSLLSAAPALLRPPQVAAVAVRYATKKSGSSSKNLGGKSRGKSYGIKKMEGERVPGLSFPRCSLPCARPSFEEQENLASCSPLSSLEHVAPDERVRESLRGVGALRKSG